MKINFCVLFLALSVTAHGSHKHKHAEDEVEEEHHREVSLNATSNHNHSISTFRKSDPCVPKFELDEYDVGLHVLSIFVLVVVSLMGSVSPVLLSNRFNGIKSRFILHLGLLFGAGTILSTGFIHSIHFFI